MARGHFEPIWVEPVLVERFNRKVRASELLFDRLASGNFVSGTSGFEIQDDGTAEFNSGLTIGGSAIVSVDIKSSGWDGTVPGAGDASVGYMLDYSADLAEFRTLYAGTLVTGDIDEASAGAGVDIDGLSVIDGLVLAANGSTTKHAYGFLTSPTTGMYHSFSVGRDYLWFEAGGVPGMVLTGDSPDGQLIMQVPLEAIAGTAASPGLNFGGKTGPQDMNDSGFFAQASVDEIGVSIASTEIANFTGSGFEVDTIGELTALAGVTIDGLLIKDGSIPEAAVTEHQAALSITESQIADLNHTIATLNDVGNVTITSIATGELLKWSGSAWVNNTLAEAGISATGHSHTESDITDLDHLIEDDAYGAGWDADTTHAPSQNAVYDKLNSMDGVTDIIQKFFWGSFEEEMDAVTSYSAPNIVLTLGAKGGGDLTYRHSGGTSTVTDGSTVNLTAGSDASPQQNFVYILQSAPTTLVVSTTEWPSAEHVRVAYYLVPSTTEYQADGCYVEQQWNQERSDADDSMGHLFHIGQWLRTQGATYISGVAGAGTDDYITIVDSSNVDFAHTAGVVAQHHSHSVPAFDSGTGDDIHVKNWSGDAYHEISSLTEITADSTGSNTNNRWMKLVFWGVANKGGVGDKVMVNLPSGTYATEAAALADDSGYADFTIPREFNIDSSSGYLICAIVMKDAVNWVYGSTTDLRGAKSAIVAGGSGGGASGSTFADNAFKVFDESDDTKLLAFQVSGVTTATTRTLTVPDASGTIELEGHTHLEADVTDLDHWDATDDNAGIDARVTKAFVDALNVDADTLDGSDSSDFATAAHTHAFGDLSNVTATEAVRNVPAWSGSAWVGRPLVEADISDLQAYALAANLHDEAHTIASHSDTTATGAELETLTDGSNADALHVHAATVIAALNDITNVTITTIASGEILKWNGSAWINNTLAEAGIAATGDLHAEAHTIASHSDTTATGAELETLTDGSNADALHVHAAAGLDLADLGDVTITSIAAGELLKWSGSAWINNTLAEAGVSATGHTHLEADVTDLGAYLLNLSAESIGDLGDVDTSTATVDDLLVYELGGWATQTLAEAGIMAVGAAPTAHTIASHSDTTGTGAELEALTDGSDVSALHNHDTWGNDYVPKSGTTMTGALQVPNGTVGAPGLQLGASDTGFYHTGDIGVTVDNTLLQAWSSSTGVKIWNADLHLAAGIEFDTENEGLQSADGSRMLGVNDEGVTFDDSVLHTPTWVHGHPADVTSGIVNNAYTSLGSITLWTHAGQDRSIVAQAWGQYSATWTSASAINMFIRVGISHNGGSTWSYSDNTDGFVGNVASTQGYRLHLHEMHQVAATATGNVVARIEYYVVGGTDPTNIVNVSLMGTANQLH